MSAASNEVFRFWQQLANAGMIEGSYSGITQGSTVYSCTTANSPAGKISASLWFVGAFGNISGNGSLFDGSYGNVLEFGGIYANDQPLTNIFKPEEMWNIDTKLDDG